MWRSFYIRYRNYFHYVLLRKKGKAVPLPLSYWESLKSRLARQVKKTDVLLPAQKLVKSKGRSVHTAAVRSLIAKDTIGVWTLDRLTIDLLWKELVRSRPKVLAECGCGISTLLIAKYLQQYEPEGMCVSFEQSESEIKRVRDRLAGAGLDQTIHFIYTPVDGNGEYDFKDASIQDILKTKKMDWIIIDGPSGPDKSRQNTLPVLMRYTAPGCHWWLDDALRDGEMEFLREWERIPGITVSGIIPVGKGLGTGSVSYSQKNENGS